MAADHTSITARRTRLRGLVAMLGAASVAMLHHAGRAGDAPVVSPAEGPIHFYSTAAPPEHHPGPTPEEVAAAPVDPGVALAAMTPADPPTSEPPSPSPPPSTNPAPEPEPADSPAPGPVPAPDRDPMRVASATPVDRVPGADRLPTAPEASTAEADPIAVAKAMLAACKARYDTVRDYTCTFIKRERVNGRLSGFEVMAMKARTRPMSVYFKFRQPNAGREAIYVHGRNGGKAVVHDVGFGRLLAGTLHLDPRSRRAMEGNRHPITEAGIGFLIETLLEGWHREMNPIDSVVTIREGVLVNKRPTTMIVCTHPRRERHFVFHEVRLYIDRELGLPIRFEAYDWPRGDGEPPPLLEEYTYADLRLDVGLTDLDFDPSNKAYSFGRF